MNNPNHVCSFCEYQDDSIILGKGGALCKNCAREFIDACLNPDLVKSFSVLFERSSERCNFCLKNDSGPVFQKRDSIICITCLGLFIGAFLAHNLDHIELIKKGKKLEKAILCRSDSIARNNRNNSKKAGDDDNLVT